MYKLSSKIVTRKVTAKECASFLDYNNFPGQRALSEGKARRYSDLLISGLLRPVEIAFATCPDGNRYLMNGQHVCQGCVWANREMDATITYYKCETWTDAWKLFATFDVHAARTQGQIFGAARGLFTNESLRDVPIRVLQSCGSALACLTKDSAEFSRGQKTADKITKPQLVEDNPKDVLWVSTFSDASHLMKVGCVAAMIATHRKSPTKAEEFWRKIQTGLEFKSKTEPEKRLYDFLNNGNASSKTHTNSKTHHGIMFATCVSWWNSWVKGEKRISVKVAAMQEMPKVLS